MDIGDVVYLKQPFQPEPNRSEFYRFAIVVGFSQDDGSVASSSSEVVVHLYDPESSTLYTDELGEQALFSFKQDEIEEQQ